VRITTCGRPRRKYSPTSRAGKNPSLTIFVGRYGRVRGRSNRIGISVRIGVSAYSGFFDAGAAALTVMVALAAAAWNGERRRPVAFEIGQDGLTTWDRAGHAQYRRISGCAQWSDRLLALILVPAEDRCASFLVAADALTDTTAFRELAVRARRCAQEHL
jgi:hypothetical protein